MVGDAIRGRAALLHDDEALSVQAGDRGDEEAVGRDGHAVYAGNLRAARREIEHDGPRSRRSPRSCRP